MKIVVEIISTFVLIYVCYVIKFFSSVQGVYMNRPDPDIILTKAL